MQIYKIPALLMCMMMLFGCVPETAQWTVSESPKKNKVERVVLTYFVTYPAHATTLEAKEKKKFQKFLNENVPSPYAIAATLCECGGISEKRVKDIKRELLRYGVSEDLISVIDDLEGDTPKRSKKHACSGVEIIIERFLVIPPSCSNFSQNIGSARQDAHSSNYGCSVEANLGMIVANPRDLIRGRSRDPYNGILLAESVSRYYTRKIAPLIDTSTTVAPTQQSNTTTPTATTPGVY